MHWADEAMRFADDAGRRLLPSMRQRIDLEVLYTASLRRVRRLADASGPAAALPEACPFELDTLFAGDVAELMALLG